MTDSAANGGSRIVVGVDGSEHSRRALRWAGYFARPLKARLEAVAAWRIPAMFGEAVLPEEWHPEQEMASRLHEAVAESLALTPDIEVHESVVEGDAAGVLVDRGRDASMIVVGSRGRGGFAGLLLGSVSTRVVQHAACPVFVVRGTTEPPTVA